MRRPHSPMPSPGDQVLYSGVACISDLIVKEGLINPTSATLGQDAQEGQGHDGQGRGFWRKSRAHRRRGRDFQSIDREPLDGRQWPHNLHYWRQGPDVIRGRRSWLPAFAKRPTRTPTSSLAHRSMRAWRVIVALAAAASINSTRCSRRNQRKLTSQAAPRPAVRSPDPDRAWCTARPTRHIVAS